MWWLIFAYELAITYYYYYYYYFKITNGFFDRALIATHSMIRLRLKKLLRNQLGAGNQSELRERKNGLELVTWVKNCDIRLKNNALVKTSFTRSGNHRISITYHMIHVTGAICIHKCAASIGVLFLISCIQFHFSESSPTVNYTVTWWLLRRITILLETSFYWGLRIVKEVMEAC